MRYEKKEARKFEGVFKGYYLDRNPGHSNPEIITGVKSGDQAPCGLHIHGGNGTFADYGHAEYVPAAHRIGAVFEITCPYRDDFGEQVVEKKTVYMDLCPFNDRYSERRAMIIRNIGRQAIKYCAEKFDGKDILVYFTHEPGGSGKKEWEFADEEAKQVLIKAVEDNYRYMKQNA